MEDKYYEIRVFIEDVTDEFDVDSELMKMSGGFIWNVWVYMPAFGQLYCSAYDRQVYKLHAGVVTMSQIETQEFPESWTDEKVEKWYEKLDELCRDNCPDDDFDTFYDKDALEWSFDDTLDCNGKRWADYDDLEEAMADLDEAYEKGARRDDTHGHRNNLLKAVKEILDSARENYVCNDITRAVTRFFDEREARLLTPERAQMTLDGIVFDNHQVKTVVETWEAGKTGLTLTHYLRRHSAWSLTWSGPRLGQFVWGDSAPTPEEALVKFTQDPRFKKLNLSLDQFKGT